MDKKFNKLFNNQVIQFFFIGAIMYLCYFFILQLNTKDQEQDKTITITSGEIVSLLEIWTSRYNRPPTEIEMERLIKQHLEEIILFKEALKMGLNLNDEVIRRRMSQKLQFLSDDLIRPETPTEDELRDYFITNISAYTPKNKITISQIYFDKNFRGDKITSDVENILVKLNSLNSFPSKTKNYGDSFSLQGYFALKSEDELSKLFDRKFASNVFKLDQSKWLGPIESKYGVHLVYVHKKTLAKVPKIEEVREFVFDDWMRMKQKDLNNLYIDGLLDRYEIVFESVNNFNKEFQINK